MANDWFLTYNGQTKTLAAWAIDSVQFDFNNLAADVVTFTVAGRAVDAADFFPYGSTVIILKPDGVTRWFYGRVEPWSRSGMADNQSHFGRLVNPWWYLDHLTYKQTYYLYVPVAGFAYTPADRALFKGTTTNRVLLNISQDPVTGGINQITTGQQIAAALQWAITNGAPIKIGDMAPWAQPWAEFVKNIKCSEIIHKMFQIESDFVMDWDYTTVPFPTVHFRKASNLAAGDGTTRLAPIAIDLTTPGILDKIKITPRPDWQKSYVNIDYEQTNTVQGQQFLILANDHYPDPLPAAGDAPFLGLDLYLDLTGQKVSSSSQTASFASITADITNIATWKNWKPELAAAEVSTAVITPVTTPVLAPQDEDGALDPSCLFEVVDGEWADWIPGVNGQRCRVTASIDIVKTNGDKHTIQASHDMTLVSFNTRGVSTPFTVNSTSFTAAEPQPAGLARIVYNAWQANVIEGTVNCTELIANGTYDFTRSNCLNFLTPNQPAWSAVRALIQQISGDLDKGVTGVKFGAPPMMNPSELKHLLWLARFRQPVPDLNFLLGGPLSVGGGNTKLGRKTHARQSQSGTPKHDKLSAATSLAAGAFNADGTATNPAPGLPAGYNAVTAVINPADMIAADGANVAKTPVMAAKMQPVPAVVAGVNKTISIMASEPPDSLGTSGWHFVTAIEADSTQTYPAQAVIHVQASSSLATTGIRDAANPTGPLVVSKAGYYVSRQAVPAQAVVSGNNVWNLPQYPEPNTANKDDALNFWLYLGEIYC